MDVLTVLLKPNGTIDSSFGINGISLIDGGIHINDGGISILSRDANSFIICGSDGLKYYEMIKFSSGSFPNLIHKIEKEEMTMYPNPAHDHIYFKSANNISAFLVYDELGRICLNQLFNCNQGELNISALLPGVYYMIAKNGIEIIGRKLIQKE